MIRVIETDELSTFGTMAGEFYSKLGLPGQFKREVFLNYWNKLIQSKSGFILGRFIDDEPVAKDE